MHNYNSGIFWGVERMGYFGRQHNRFYSTCKHSIYYCGGCSSILLKLYTFKNFVCVTDVTVKIRVSKMKDEKWKGYTVRKAEWGSITVVLSRNMENGLEIIKYKSDLCWKMIDWICVFAFTLPWNPIILTLGLSPQRPTEVEKQKHKLLHVEA